MSQPYFCPVGVYYEPNNALVLAEVTDHNFPFFNTVLLTPEGEFSGDPITKDVENAACHFGKRLWSAKQNAFK